MRSKFRARRTIAPTILLCLLIYIYITTRSPNSTETTETTPSFETSSSFKPTYEILHHTHLESNPPSPAFAHNIAAFWDHWSDVFHDARPSPEEMRLSSNANAVDVPPGDDGPRQPPRNRIMNSEEDIESMRASHASLLTTLESEDVAGEIFEGAGVVTVGGGEYFGPAIIGLHMLRKSGCSLPVEIFVADDDEYEPAICEDYLPRYGARCLVLSHFLQGENASHTFDVKHYQLKSLAILFSSFADILYIDSDSIPLIDISTLFLTEPYTSTGLIIWPDFWIASESPHFYTIAGLSSFPSNLPKSSSEAGQLFVNKKTHLKTLLLATYYNIFGPSHYYPLLSQGVLGQGDKETFMAAAIVLNQPYHRVKTRVRSVGRHDGRKYKGSGMIQHYPSKGEGEVGAAFLHANTPKMNAGHLVDEGDLFGTKKQRLRLWGAREEQVERFGGDLERGVWELLVQTGCELEGVVREWVGRERLCGRLEDHWGGVFGDG